MNIGLDYDDTFTADKELWGWFVGKCLRKGYDVRFVTFRFEETRSYTNEDIKLDSEKLGIPIIFCNGIQKAEVTSAARFPVDIWIDDFPVGIPLKHHLEGMAQGVRINDNKIRTSLTNNPDWSTEPLVINNA